MEAFPGACGSVVAELPAPTAFTGQSIAQVDVRRSYGVSVLMVRHSDAHGKQSLTTSPPADYTFRSGDVLLVLGPAERVRRLQRGDWTAGGDGAGGS
jgi:trk system potassium uptake protein TrkA